MQKTGWFESNNEKSAFQAKTEVVIRGVYYASDRANIILEEGGSHKSELHGQSELSLVI